jgi:glycosyltransferase involved in cell wall biosynthesis
VKKILFLIGTLNGGGAEKVLVDLVNRLDKKKYQITLQTIIDTGVYKNSLAGHIKYKSINKLKNTFLRKILSYMVFFVLSPALTYRFFVKDDYDYEIAFLEGMPVKILACSNNKKAVKYAWVHTDLYNNYNGFGKIFPDFTEHIKVYEKFAKIVFVSESARDGFVKRFGFQKNSEKLIVKYNIIDDIAVTEQGGEAVSGFDGVSGGITLVTVGRLVEQKGYDRLLRVFKRLRDAGFDCGLWIIGDGSKRAEMESFISENNLDSFVKLLGFQKNPYKFVKKADLFVCSSYAEGFSTAVTEALILKTPVVTTDCAGMKELLRGGEYGLIVENSEDGIFDGIKKIISEPNLLSGQRERLKTANCFSMENNLREIEKLFI